MGISLSQAGRMWDINPTIIANWLEDPEKHQPLPVNKFAKTYSKKYRISNIDTAKLMITEILKFRTQNIAVTILMAIKITLKIKLSLLGGKHENIRK